MIKYYKNTEDGKVHEVVGDEAYQTDCLIFNPTYIDATQEEIEAFVGNTLTIAKDSKCSEINARTDELILDGITYNGIAFEMKMEDQANINTLFSLLNNGMDLTGQYFRAKDQDYYFSSNEDFIMLVQNATSAKTIHIQTGASLKNQVKYCTSIQEVQEIVDNR